MEQANTQNCVQAKIDFYVYIRLYYVLYPITYHIIGYNHLLTLDNVYRIIYCVAIDRTRWKFKIFLILYIATYVCEIIKESSRYNFVFIKIMYITCINRHHATFGPNFVANLILNHLLYE